MPICITLNGRETELEDGTTVAELLEHRKLRKEMVTVQINSVALDRDKYEGTELKDGDEVEILFHMGGGVNGKLGN